MANKKKGRKNKGVSRRTFNKLAIGTGLALGSGTLGSLFSGCGGGGGGTETGGIETETRKFHFDFSHLQSEKVITLHVYDQEITLTPHTNTTLADAKTADPALEHIPDTYLTHFAEVELPSKGPTLMFTTHEDPSAEVAGHIYSHLHFHIPILDPTANIQASKAWVPGGVNLKSPAACSYLDHGDHFNPWKIARALMFLHPETLKMDDDTCAIISAHIDKNLHVCLLASVIKGLHDYGLNWAKQIPLQDVDTGDNLYDSETGDPLFKIEPVDDIKDYLIAAHESLLKTLMDDSSLENNKSGAGGMYTTADGESHLAQESKPYSEKMLLKSGSGSGYGISMTNTGEKDGIETSMTVVESSGREIDIETTNHWQRYLSLWAIYKVASGDEIEREQLDTIIATPLIMGIPIGADTYTHTVTLPESASMVDITYGSMGNGGTYDPDLISEGATLTAVFGYALPLFLLSVQAGLRTTKFKKFLEDKGIKRELTAWGKYLFPSIGTKVVGGVVVEATTFGTTYAITGNWKASLALTVNLLGGLVWGAGVNALKTWIVEQITSATARKALPIVGVVMWAAENAATIAGLAQTTHAVINGEWTLTRTVKFSLDVRVKMHPDYRNTVFPTTAEKYKVILQPNNAEAIVIEGTMPATTTDLIEETFTDVPSGGTLKVTASFMTDDDIVVGKFESRDHEALLESNQSELLIEGNIVELKVALTNETEYNHKQKLIYTGSAYKWQGTSTAPSTLADSLDCSSGLCTLFGITFNQPSGQIGYSWKAFSAGIGSCEAGASATTLNFLQSVTNVSNTVDSAKKTVSCGFGAPTPLAYHLIGLTEPPNEYGEPPTDEPDQSPKNSYYLDPSIDITGRRKFLLRKIDIGDSGSSFKFGAAANDKCYGRFGMEVEAIAYHPQGYIVGANYTYSKIAVLKIEEEAVPDEEARISWQFGGHGTRKGLMKGPRAVSISADGTIYVLESGNKRAQAFDIKGNPIKKFGNNRDKHYFELRQDHESQTYLDMGVEFSGFVYVLSYINGGTSVDDYFLDIYRPDGNWLSQTTGVAAGKLVVDFWRNMYTLNYETISGAPNTEPSVSLWIPNVTATEA